MGPVTSQTLSPRAQGNLARAVLFTLTVLTTVCASIVFADRSWMDGIHILDPLLMALFLVLFGWISVSFWTSTVGFVVALVRDPPIERRPLAARRYAKLPRTALVMPVYNESPERVFAGVRAIYESVQRTGHGAVFDFFVLSDSTDPEIWLREEMQFADFRADIRGESRVFYRHRPENIERKSGNIADFCRQWGSAYAYMVVLDADSLMSGTTLLEMVRRMEESPDLGILQAPPVPVNQGSFFARCQQFAASVYGEAYITGFAVWTQTDGNYFGHNAIIRVAAFMEEAGLPRLPGREPLGGEILSHDFVEAALLRRAGWKIRVDDDLYGSYEECPTTLIDYALRDQRWCQGNMQHLRLIFLYGFHPVSRLHLGMGAMSYLSSPLWLLFLLVGWLEAAIQPAGLTSLRLPKVFPSHSVIIDFVLMTGMLFLPKVWGLILLFRSRTMVKAHGGVIKAALSTVIEATVSVLIAPILMAFHVKFVFSTLAGRKVQWNVQRRGDAVMSFPEALRAHTSQTYLGIGASLLTLWLTPHLFWWLVPVLAGLVLAIPLSTLLSSVPVGRWLQQRGLLLIPEETIAPRELTDQRDYIEELLARQQSQTRLEPVDRVILDPAFNALHVGILEATGGVGEPVGEGIRQTVLTKGPKFLRKEEVLALLADAQTLRQLHRSAWSEWPVAALHSATAFLTNTPLH